MRSILRSVFALLVMITAVPVGSSANAEDSTYKSTSVLTGSEIEIHFSQVAFFDDDYYSFIEEANGVTYESFSIISPHGEVVITFAEGDQTPHAFVEDTIASVPYWYSDYVDILGYDSADDPAWYLFRGTYRSSYHKFSYGEVIPGNESGSVTAVYLYASDADSLLETVNWAQTYLTIDGEHPYTSTDIPAVTSMLNGTSDIEPQRFYGFTSDIEDWADQGLVSDSKWISPGRGVEVEWDTEKLYFPTFRDDTIANDPDLGADLLYLYSQNPDGMISMSIEDTRPRPEGVSFLDYYAERYASSEWLYGLNYNQPLHGSVQSETALSVIYSFSGIYNENRVYIRTVWEPSPGVMYVFDVSNHPNLIADTYMNAIDSVTFDGKPIEALWTYDELTALFPPSNDVDAEFAPANSQVSHARSAIDVLYVWTPQD